MKNTLLSLALILLSAFFVKGQTNIIVNATSGASTGSYTTLKQAFDSINSGYHQGIIQVLIVGNTSEGTYIARLDSSGTIGTSGTSSFTSVLIKPSGVVTVSGTTTAGSALIHINGADNVTIDGLNNGMDSLIITNTTASATAGTSTIQFINDASNNLIKRTTILGAPIMSTTTNGGVVVFSTASTYSAAGNNNNRIAQCYIANSNSTNTNFPYKLIYLNGTATSLATANKGIQIDSNQLVNYRSNGVYVNSGNAGTLIRYNHMYHTATLASNAVVFAPVWVSNATSGIGENYLISNNFIGGSQPFCGGTKPLITLTSVFQFIYINSATTAPSTISNNMVSNMQFAVSSTTANYGFVFVMGGRINCTGNLFGSATDTSNIIVTYNSSSGQTTLAGFAFGGTTTTPVIDTQYFQGNMVGGITLVSTNTQGIALRGFDPQGTGGTFIIRNNSIGAPGVPNSISYYAVNNNVFGIITRNGASTKQNQFVGNYIGNITLKMYSGSSSNTRLIGISATSYYWRVDSNTVENLIDYSTAVGIDDNSLLIGIDFRPGDAAAFTHSCVGNTVSNLIAMSSTVVSNIIGINAGGATTATSNIFASNRIRKLYSVSQDTAVIVGMRINYSGTNNFLMYNNEITLGTDSSGNDITSPFSIYGIKRINGNVNLYHNTVLVRGLGVAVASHTANSYAFMDSVAGSRDIRNNVFVNARSFSTTSTNYNASVYLCGALSSGSVSGLTLDNNLYYTSGTGSATVINGSVYSSLSSWKLTAYMHDFSSVSANPLFYSNFRLEGTTGSGISFGASSLGITTDILNNPRYVYLMGAYEQLYTLPVTYLSFTASRRDNTAVLNWSTASEKNNRGFNVERSLNGQDFNDISFVAGNVNSSTVNYYQFNDENIFDLTHSPAVYYRLRQQDLDGHESKSGIVTIKVNEVENVPSVFPNPFSENLRIKLANKKIGDVSLRLIDILGRIQYSTNLFYNGSDEYISLDNLFNLVPGIYYLEMNSNDGKYCFKLLKQ